MRKQTDQIGLMADRQLLYVTNESKSIRDILYDQLDGESIKCVVWETVLEILEIPVKINEQSHRVLCSEAKQKFKRWEARAEEEKTISVGTIAEVVAKMKNRKSL
jgi:hypothetical protein